MGYLHLVTPYTFSFTDQDKAKYKLLSKQFWDTSSHSEDCSRVWKLPHDLEGILGVSDFLLWDRSYIK